MIWCFEGLSSILEALRSLGLEQNWILFFSENLRKFTLRRQWNISRICHWHSHHNLVSCTQVSVKLKWQPTSCNLYSTAARALISTHMHTIQLQSCLDQCWLICIGKEWLPCCNTASTLTWDCVMEDNAIERLSFSTSILKKMLSTRISQLWTQWRWRNTFSWWTHQ